MTARRRWVPLAVSLTIFAALGCGLAAGFAHTPDIAVIDVTYSIEGN